MGNLINKKMIWAIMKKKGDSPPEHYYKKIPLKNYDFYLLHKGNFEDWDYKKTKEGIIFTSKRPILINPSLSGYEPDPEKYCRFLRRLPLTERKWSSIEPSKTKSGRLKILEKYGPYAFLDPENLKYPIISRRGEFSTKGLLAAYKRARQWGDDKIAELAEEIGKCMGLSWARLNPSKLISLWFDRRFWTLKSARKYLKDFDLQYHDYIRTEDYYKFPQGDIDKFEKFEKKNYGDGIIGIVGIDSAIENPKEINYNLDMEKNPKNEALKYYENAKEILKKAEPDYEIGTYQNIKYVQEAFGTLWLAILKAIDYALLKRGLTEKELPQDSKVYGAFIKKYLSHRDGKLQKAFQDLYDEIHIAGYYRGNLKGIETIKESFQLARRFIDKLLE